MNSIGLDKTRAQELAGKLNDLLSDYSVFYQNTRAYHWNVKGANFFELHIKFEELYNNLFLKIDEIAERILTLGEVPNYKFSHYLGSSSIKETNEVFDGKKSLAEILEVFKILLTKQRAIMALAGEIGDEGTASQMSDYIREQEKLVWMYSAYLR